MTDRRPDGTQPGDDRLMMESPHFWPKRPILTLKRYSGASWPDLAILYEDDFGDEICFRLHKDNNALDVTLDVLLEAPKVTIDQVLADGWVVD